MRLGVRWRAAAWGTFALAAVLVSALAPGRLVLAASPGGGGAELAAPEPVRVEPSELLGLVEESGVVQRPPSPGLGSWAADLVSRASLRLSRWMKELSRRFEQWLLTSLESLGLPPAVWLRRAAYAIVAVAVAVLLVGLLRVFAVRRGRGKPPRAATVEAVALPAPPAAGASDAAAWRGEAELHLAAGRLADALEAIWWWMARALAGERADASWTGRELLIHTGRRDLAPAVRHLEAMTYGPVRPAPAEVRSFVAQLARALP